MEVLPVLTDSNYKLSDAFSVVYESVYASVIKKLEQDCSFMRSNETYAIAHNMSALLYCHLIYLDITDPYVEVLTLEEYKDKYEYNTKIQEFHKVGVHLHNVFDSYDFQTIIDSL